MPVTFRIIDRLPMKSFSKKANFWHKGTRRENPKEEKGKKSDLSTDVSAPSTLTAQIQIVSSPSTKQGTAMGTGLPQPCVWEVSIKVSERTNSLPCSLSSSEDTFTPFQPPAT